MIELMNSLGITWIEIVSAIIILGILAYRIWKDGFINTVKKVIVEIEHDYLNDGNIDKLEEAVLKLNSKSFIIKFLVSNDYIRGIIKDLVKWARDVQPKK